MKITLIQTLLHWEDPAANRIHFSERIKSIGEKTDLIILPEMFSTGFTMAPQIVAEAANGETVKWMQQMAKQYDCAITGSLIITEKDKFYNRLLFVHPDGTIEKYDKRHLFGLANESEIFTAGKDKLTVNYKGWKICPLVCYDLRFPVFSRNVEEYDLLLYVANWPVARVQAWDTLLPARAVENMCYVAGVNRTGEDSNENEYNGHSHVYDFLGTPMNLLSEEEKNITVTLDKDALNEVRDKFGFLNDRDRFTLQD